MKSMRLGVFSLIALLPVLAACATPGVKSQYQQDLDRLEAGCRDRQGILISTGDQTGRPETDYACKITGGASRIPAN
jgi:hypothetical protein